MDRCGEIIATNTTHFVAESFTLHQPPALGSLVEVQPAAGLTVYAVVCFGSTGGLDPGRRVVRRSTDDAFDASIYQAHPQLAKTLHTEFSALLVGYRRGDGPLRRHLPAQPPPLHFSVVACAPATVCQFTDELVYLRLLLNVQGELPAEQLLAAHIRQVYEVRGEDDAWLARAAREVASLLKSDYERLLSVLLSVQF
jgi:hypothetical protein